MKRLKIVILFLLIFAALPVKSSHAYPGGLLNGLPMYVGDNVGMYDTPKLEMTDNNLSTSWTISALNGLQDTFFLDFATAKTISGVQIAADRTNGLLIKFMDATGKTIDQFNSIQNGTKTNIYVTGVRRVSIVNNGTTSNSIYEFDLFEEGAVTPSATPTPSPTVSSTPTPSPTATPVSSPTPTATPVPSPSATPTPTPSATPDQTGDRAILTITLINGIEKEYDLPIAEVNAFLTWYDARDAGRSTGLYAIDKHTNNKGPFGKRKDYVIFDKILTFEVSEYTTE